MQNEFNRINPSNIANAGVEAESSDKQKETKKSKEVGKHRGSTINAESNVNKLLQMFEAKSKVTSQKKDSRNVNVLAQLQGRKDSSEKEKYSRENIGNNSNSLKKDVDQTKLTELNKHKVAGDVNSRSDKLLGNTKKSRSTFIKNVSVKDKIHSFENIITNQNIEIPREKVHIKHVDKSLDLKNTSVSIENEELQEQNSSKLPESDITSLYEDKKTPVENINTSLPESDITSLYEDKKIPVENINTSLSESDITSLYEDKETPVENINTSLPEQKDISGQYNWGQMIETLENEIYNTEIQMESNLETVEEWKEDKAKLLNLTALILAMEEQQGSEITEHELNAAELSMDDLLKAREVLKQQFPNI